MILRSPMRLFSSLFVLFHGSKESSGCLRVLSLRIQSQIFFKLCLGLRPPVKPKTTEAHLVVSQAKIRLLEDRFLKVPDRLRVVAPVGFRNGQVVELLS